jgi:hypothetical protein
MDEAAFLEGAAELYRGAMPTLSMVGEAAKVIVVSTPDTELDWFGQLWHADAGDLEPRRHPLLATSDLRLRPRLGAAHPRVAPYDHRGMELRVRAAVRCHRHPDLSERPDSPGPPAATGENAAR